MKKIRGKRIGDKRIRDPPDFLFSYLFMNYELDKVT